MNNYHLYEEIGQGKYSMVYKGRKRHTIRYVAVKSIEKNRRDKVMMEVSVLAQLQHPNIVGFINWYETRNHLWIIFEYCAGGDVLRLLRQDGRLPEDAVRRFGRDICAGLLHVHAKGIVYSDLKPANVLFVEDGTLKLSDFGHSQRLDDIGRAVQEGALLPRRGTPHYMAPELFVEGGMHSFASDLWALGCVLHELLVGRPPFQSSSFSQLQQIVLHDPAPVGSGACSGETGSLLASLLQKPPLSRIGWPQLRAHGFWHGRSLGDDNDARSLPTEPHLEELRRVWQNAFGGGTKQARSAASTPASSPARPHGNDNAVALPSRQSSRSQLRPSSSGHRLATDGMHPEGTALPDPPRIGGNAGAVAATSAVAGATGTHGVGAATPPVAPQLVTTKIDSGSPTPNQATALPVGLRSRLGVPTYARVREVVVATETGVRPISRNPQIEELEPLEAPAPEHLPFTPLRLDEVCLQPQAEVEAFLAQVYKCIAQGSQEQRLSAIVYLEQICCHMQIADIVVNSSLLRLVLRMLQSKKAGTTGGVAALPLAAPPQLRVRLLSLIGQLLRHATFIEPSAADLGLVDALLDGLIDKGEPMQVRRRSAAALGELLFYVATQPAVTPPQQSGTGASAPSGNSGWLISSSVFRGLARVVSNPSEDEVVQHYVAKTVENVATQCPAVALQWFSSAELLRALENHARRSSWDPFRLSCLAAVAHLLRARTESDSALEACSVDPDLVLLCLETLAPQGVPHGLQLLASALSSAPTLDAVAAALPEQPGELIMGIVSQPRYSSALRGRACVLLTMLFALDDVREVKHLRAAIDCSFIPHIDRLGREKDPLVVQCVAAAAVVMDIVVVQILQSLVEGLRQLSASSDPSVVPELATNLVQILPVFLHLLSSVTLCGCVFGSRALPLLSAACELTSRAPPGPAAHNDGSTASSALHQLQPLLLMIMEALGLQQAMLLEHAPQMVRCVLPALAVCLSAPRADVRLLALKAFSAVCVTLLNDRHVFEPAGDQSQPTSETTALLEALLCGRVLPVLPRLLMDEAPAPSCALRLLAAILSRGSVAAGTAVRDLGLAQPLLAALRGQQALNLHTALLAQCLLRGGAVRARDLREAGVLDAVAVALAEAAEAAKSSHLAQMDFAMVDAALCVAEEVFKQTMGAVQYQQQPQKLLQIVSELGPLPQALPLLAALCTPLAQARLVPLLDRATACCECLAELARVCGPLTGQTGSRALVAELQPRHTLALLHTLAVVAQWRRHSAPASPEAGAAATGAGANASVVVSMQRRLLAVLSWAIAVGANAEVRAEVAVGIEQLLRERVLGDDDNPDVVAEARKVIASSAVAGSGPARGAGSGR